MIEIQVNNLVKSFEVGKNVLDGLTFQVDQGERVGLLGRNGAGKTTLMNCLAGEFPPDGGAFCVEDGDGERRPLAEGDVGYVLSTPVVPEFLTGWEFVKFFQEINAGKDPTGRTPDDWLDLVGIDAEDRCRLMKDYSHGMKNKMQMLVNIIAQPNILLLDEPLTSLDVVVAEEMKNLLRSLKDGRITIFSTHILDLALDLCDEIVLLSHGELEVVEKSNLDDHAFKDKIIAALKEESYA